MLHPSGLFSQSMYYFSITNPSRQGSGLLVVPNNTVQHFAPALKSLGGFQCVFLHAAQEQPKRSVVAAVEFLSFSLAKNYSQPKSQPLGVFLLPSCYLLKMRSYLCFIPSVGGDWSIGENGVQPYQLRSACLATYSQSRGSWLSAFSTLVSMLPL